MNALTELNAKLNTLEEALTSNTRDLKVFVKKGLIDEEGISTYIEYNIELAEEISKVKDEISRIEDTPIAVLIAEDKPIAQLIAEAKKEAVKTPVKKPVKKSKIVIDYEDEEEKPKPAKKYAHKARAFVGKASTHNCEPGIRNGKIYLPVCRMGAIGKNGILAFPIENGVHYHKIPKRMGRDWFAFIATTLKKLSCYDFDAHSFQRNIILPNLDKICEDCGVSSPIIRARIESDMFVGLDKWFSGLGGDAWFTDEDLDF